MASFIKHLKTLRPLIQLRTVSSSSPTSSCSAINPETSISSLNGKKKSRAVIALLKVETDPDKIVEICQSATLSPESTLDRVAMSVAVSKLAQSNSLDAIRHFVEHLNGLPHWQNERFVSHSIILYGQAGMLKNAIDTFKQMGQLGIERTVRSLNALLFACILAKKYEEVKGIFTDFPKMYNIEPNTETYNYLIEAFCELDESSSGYLALTQMVSNRCKPNETTFGHLLAGFYKEGKFDDVGKVLKLMEDHGMKPGPETYNFRIQSLCKLGRSFEAKALLDGMFKRGVKPNTATYRNLIHGFCKEGKLEDAKNVFNSMVSHGCEPDSECYFTIVSFLCQGGDYVLALHFTKQCIKKGWIPYFNTMKSLVEGLASMSRVKEAKDLLVQIKARFPNSSHLWAETEEKLSKVTTTPSL